METSAETTTCKCSGPTAEYFVPAEWRSQTCIDTGGTPIWRVLNSADRSLDPPVMQGFRCCNEPSISIRPHDAVSDCVALESVQVRQWATRDSGDSLYYVGFVPDQS